MGDENIGNMSNVKRGKEFQLRAQSALEKLTGIQFKLEVKLPIGRPPKLHPFDLASPDQRIIGESTAYTGSQPGGVTGRVAVRVLGYRGWRNPALAPIP